MRAAERYFPVGHCIYYSVQVGVTFESGDEILKCEHSNASCCARMYYFFGGTVCFVVQVEVVAELLSLRMKFSLVMLYML